MRWASRARMSASRKANHAAYLKSIGTANSGQTPGTALTITAPAGGVPAGHTLIIRSATDYTTAAPTVADTRGNSYTSLRSAAGTGNSLRATIHAATLATALQAGDVITLTTTAAINRAWSVDEFTGLAVPLTVDAANGASANSATPDANVATANPTDLVVALVASTAALTDGYAPDPNWTATSRAGTTGTAPCISLEGAHRAATSTSTWHFKPVLSAAAPWVGLAVALKSA